MYNTKRYAINNKWSDLTLNTMPSPYFQNQNHQSESRSLEEPHLRLLISANCFMLYGRPFIFKVW